MQTSVREKILSHFYPKKTAAFLTRLVFVCSNFRLPSRQAYSREQSDSVFGLSSAQRKRVTRTTFAGNARRWFTFETPSRIYQCRALPVSVSETCETTRKPILLFQLSGVFLLRFAQRTLRPSLL
jgi:hypothetical protein